MNALRVLIIEDEPLARKHLIRKLSEVVPDWKIVGEAESVVQAIEALQDKEIDLILSDIQLSDGLSFEAFEKIKPKVPIVFTTAYNQYALKAFQSAGIAYLLKPISSSDLKKCISSLQLLGQKFSDVSDTVHTELLQKLMNQMKPVSKRLLIKTGEKYYPVDIDDIMYFEYDQITFAYDSQGKKHPVEESLNQIQEKLPHAQWFRINRQQLVSLTYVKVAHQYLGGRLKLELKNKTTTELLVSREKVSDFRVWLSGF